MIEEEFDEAAVEAKLSDLIRLSSFDTDPSDLEEIQELQAAFEKRRQGRHPGSQ